MRRIAKVWFIKAFIKGMCVRVVSLVIILTVCAGLASGCAILSGRKSGETPPQQTPPKQEEPKPTETKVTLTLYFADKDARYLVPEKREVTRKNELIAELVVRELINGPKDPNLSMTIPKEARLIPPVNVSDGIATVNFSKELKSKHWGGSAGEMLTVYSIVNSLAEVEGVKKVQILIDGKKEETLAGHLLLSEPIAPDTSIVKGK